MPNNSEEIEWAGVRVRVVIQESDFCDKSVCCQPNYSILAAVSSSLSPLTVLKVPCGFFLRDCLLHRRLWSSPVILFPCVNSLICNTFHLSLCSQRSWKGSAPSIGARYPAPLDAPHSASGSREGSAILPVLLFLPLQLVPPRSNGIRKTLTTLPPAMMVTYGYGISGWVSCSLWPFSRSWYLVSPRGCGEGIIESQDLSQ